MSKITEASVSNRRALNQAMLHAGRAPVRAFQEPRLLLRALRSALRMSQSQLAARSGLPQAHIARIEAGKTDPQWSTLRRLFDAMFCDISVLPRARKRPGDAIAERGLRSEAWRYLRLWDEKPYWPPDDNLEK